MAGRGRGAIAPAWMSNDGGGSVPGSSSVGGFGPPTTVSHAPSMMTGFGPRSGSSGSSGGGGNDKVAMVLAAIAASGSLSVRSSATPEVSAAASKSSRRIYVGGLPSGCTEADLTAFFNGVLARAYAPGDHILSTYINHDKHFSFLELKTAELATACMNLDGLPYGSTPLKIKRPNDYVPAPGSSFSGMPPINLRLDGLGLIASTVPDTPNKVFIGGLPHQLPDEEVRNLLLGFGPLKAFHLVRDNAATAAAAGVAPMSKGYAFAEWVHRSSSDAVIATLNGFALADKVLTVKYAQPLSQMGGLGGGGGSNSSSNSAAAAASNLTFPGGGGTYPPQSSSSSSFSFQDASSPSSSSSSSTSAAVISRPHGPYKTTVTKFLQCSNIATPADLASSEETQALCSEVSAEASNFGRVARVVAPATGSHVGMLFVECADLYDASEIARHFAGRAFDDRVITVDFADDLPQQ